MRKKTQAVSIGLLLSFAAAGSAIADDGTYKGRLPAVGANCRGNTHYDIEATVAGATVEGTLNGSAFRNPAKFSGASVGTTFNATIVFAAANNLRVDIVGTRADADTYTVTAKFAGGGPNNCEGTGPTKKG